METSKDGKRCLDIRSCSPDIGHDASILMCLLASCESQGFKICVSEFFFARPIILHARRIVEKLSANPGEYSLGQQAFWVVRNTLKLRTERSTKILFASFGSGPE
jgi:hypothetical protein